MFSIRRLLAPISACIVFARCGDKLFDIDEKLTPFPSFASLRDRSRRDLVTIRLRPTSNFTTAKARPDCGEYSLDATDHGPARSSNLARGGRSREVPSIPSPSNWSLKTAVRSAIAQLTRPRRHDGSPKAARAAGDNLRIGSRFCAGPYKFVRTRCRMGRIVGGNSADTERTTSLSDRVVSLPSVVGPVSIADSQERRLDLSERVAATDIKDLCSDPKLSPPPRSARL